LFLFINEDFNRATLIDRIQKNYHIPGWPLLYLKY